MIVLLLLLLRNLKHVLPLSLFLSMCYVDLLPSIEGIADTCYHFCNHHNYVIMLFRNLKGIIRNFDTFVT